MGKLAVEEKLAILADAAKFDDFDLFDTNHSVGSSGVKIAFRKVK